MRAGGLSVRSVIDAVEAELRQQILDQEIPMGAAVRETEVAHVFEVARPTAKTAIDRLVSAGLLRRDVHRSARVPVLSADDVADLYFTRSLVESQVARELAYRSALPDSSTEAISRLRALGEDAQPLRYVAPDIAFHTALTGELDSARLTKWHNELMQEMHFCMAQVQAHQLLSPTVIADEHEAIADAIRAGRPDAAARAVHEHLERACSALTDYLGDAQGLSGPGSPA